MNRLPLILLFTVLGAGAAETAPSGRIATSLQTRVGYDTNPVGSGGTSAVVLGEQDTFTYAAGLNLGYGWSSTVSPLKPGLKLNYAAEIVDFDRWSGEDYSTHRLGVSGQFTAGPWQFSADGSSLFVDGSRDTLVSVATINANSLPLWRERRQQWQHRLKLQTQAFFGSWLVRGTGSFLDYDYETKVVAGHFAFADRSDLLGGLDFGWKQHDRSLWFAGLRDGRQEQAVVPLPNCAFEYSNRYHRVVLGWEGRLSANTTLSLTAGPDFRRYTGAIDPLAMPGGRDRTSLWFEAAASTKLTSALTLSGKAARMDWLSSTGKSAYTDTSAEAAATLALNSAWSLRASAKVHVCDYFPSYRDDWESLLGAGISMKISSSTVLTLDLLRHRAWNHLADTPEREFRRFAIHLGATIKL